MTDRKNRGVRCSRVKLDAALAASDIGKKTQIALAEAVADAEQLESVPKDLVNKMFRELPVDSQTIERVAKVLKVKASSLYFDASFPHRSPAENVVLATDDVKPVQSSKQTHSVKHIYFLILFFAVLLLALQLQENNVFEFQEECLQQAIPMAGKANKLSIIIGQFTGDHDNQVQHMLRALISNDKKLNSEVNLFTSCLKVELDSNKTIQQQIIAGHKFARKELIHQQAQLIIWGERFGDRINLRLTSEDANSTLKILNFAGKTIQTNEQDFSLNFKIDDEEITSGDLQLIMLNFITPTTVEQQKQKKLLIEQYNYSGNWLKEAVLSDLNLLKKINPNADVQLYKLTVAQLCFRSRLLGDLESSEYFYQVAQDACLKALNLSPKSEDEMQWASLTGNLATIDLKLHLFATTHEQRLSRLQSALNKYQMIEKTYNIQRNIEEVATYYQNFAAVYTRLAEFDSTQADTLLSRALELSQKGIDFSQPKNNPLYYAQRLQNQCMIKYRLGAMGQERSRIQSAIKDCRDAKQYVDVQDNPQQYAMILNNLAISHAILAEVGDSIDSFNQALLIFSRAQKVYTKALYPVNWGEVELNKAELKCKLAIATKDMEVLADAKISAEQSLLLFIEKNIPRYRDYVEQLLLKIVQCQKGGFTICQCSH